MSVFHLIVIDFGDNILTLSSVNPNAVKSNAKSENPPDYNKSSGVLYFLHSFINNLYPIFLFSSILSILGKISTSLNDIFLLNKDLSCDSNNIIFIFKND
jgi:hypothetical protein